MRTVRVSERYEGNRAAGSDRKQEPEAGSMRGHTAADPDRPGRTRSRARARSVGVTELLHRRPEEVRASQPESGPGRHEQRPAGSGHGTFPRPEPPPLSRTLRVTAALMGTVLLGIGTTLTSLILHGPPPGSAGAPIAQAPPVTGAQALRPDLLHRGPRPFTAGPDFARPPGQQLDLDDLLGAPRPGTAPPRDTAAMSGLSQANPLAGSTESAVQLVTEFYRLLGTDPGRAVTLVSPGLLGSQRTEIVRSWRGLTSVRVQVEPLEGGSVVGELTAEHPDGRRIVLRHAFTVDVGTRPYIVGVELLTARHT